MTQFHTCKYCGGRFPPEDGICNGVCHECASHHEGVVY
jgi:hypothetical protein